MEVNKTILTSVIKTIAGLFLTIFFQISTLRAQSISGRVLNDRKEPMISASVMVLRNDSLKGGTVTDYDGNYVIKPIEQGIYHIQVVSMGFDSVLQTGVRVSVNETKLNFNMKPHIIKCFFDQTIITHCPKPIFDMDYPSKTTYTREDINHRR